MQHKSNVVEIQDMDVLGNPDSISAPVQTFPEQELLQVHLCLTLQAIKQRKSSSPGAPLTSTLRDAAIPAIICLCPQPYAHWSGKAAVNGDDPSVPLEPL